MSCASRNPVVHLELRTGNLARAYSFYARLFGWQAQTVHLGAGSYVALELSDRIEGGVVECDIAHAQWLPYVEVAEIHDATERAILLGAAVVLEPRQGPAGWRSIVEAPAAGQIALWQAEG